MTSVADHFDVVVVGRSLAGLACAALLAKRHLRVRIVKAAPDPELSSEPLFGLKSAPIVSRVLDELGLLHTVRTRLAAQLLPIEVVLPDRRFSLPPRGAAQRETLLRTFPDCAADLPPFLDRLEGYGGGLDEILDGDLDLPLTSFLRRRALRAVSGPSPLTALTGHRIPLPNAVPLERLSAALLALAGQRPVSPSAIDIRGARALWHLLHGLSRFTGGPDALSRVIEEKFVGYGGVLDNRRVAAELRVSGSRIDAVLSDDGRVYTTDVAVLAVSDRLAHRLLPTLGPTPPPALRQWSLETHEGRKRSGLPALGNSTLSGLVAWAPEDLGSGVRLFGRGADLFAERAVGQSLPPPPPALSSDGEPLWVPTGDDRGRPAEGAYLAPAAPFGLFRPLPPGAPQNLLRVGSAMMPGLSLESDLGTAWHIARDAARLVRHGPWLRSSGWR